jgi:gamma-glutamylcyclotransferase (GGCT)/AIG2-like uncharacterized protein YtfP
VLGSLRIEVSDLFSYRLDVLVTGWSANDQTALASTILAVGAVATGAWAVFNYQAARRARAAEWNHRLFQDFYLSTEFRRLRTRLEYGFFDEMAPLLERRLYNRDVPMSSADVETLSDLDTTLNYLEFVLYLYEERRISKGDLGAVFNYWFKLVGGPEHASLRRYASHFGFEYLARMVGATDQDLIFVYGTLISGEAAHGEINVGHQLEVVSSAVIGGRLYDVDSYPALILGAGGLVTGELYRVREGQAKSAFNSMDNFERFDARDRETSLYLRRLVRLEDPAVDAWAYVYNKEIDEQTRIACGDWRNRSA